MLIKYKVSEKEIIRREKAFFALSVSLFLGLVTTSMLFNLPISYLFFAGLTLFLALMNFWLKIFFNKFLKMETCLSKEFLIRGKEKFFTKKIVKLIIKKTTKNTVREIGISFNDGKSLFINGMNNFEKFETDLLKNVGKNVVIKNIREPLDFDSVFFYPILGLILSFFTVCLFRFLTTLNDKTMPIVLYGLLIYIFLVVTYLVISKPISKRY